MGDDHDKLLTPSQAAHWYGVSEKTLSRWRKRGLLPRPTVTLPNRRVLWSETALRATLKSHPPEEPAVATGGLVFANTAAHEHA
jgi:predicted site-specific integrase-resolvase